eukprot:485652_1
MERTTKLKCSGCERKLPEGCFTITQRSKLDNRKCKGCIQLTTPQKSGKKSPHKKKTEQQIVLKNNQYKLDIMIADWAHMYCSQDWIWQRAKIVETIRTDGTNKAQYRINTVPVDATSVSDIYEVLTEAPMIQKISENVIGRKHAYYATFKEYFQNKLPTDISAVNAISANAHPLLPNPLQPSAITAITAQNALTAQIRSVINDPIFRRDFDNRPDYSQRLFQSKNMIHFAGKFPYDQHTFCQFSLDLSNYYAENSDIDNDILFKSFIRKLNDRQRQLWMEYKQAAFNIYFDEHVKLTQDQDFLNKEYLAQYKNNAFIDDECVTK